MAINDMFAIIVEDDQPQDISVKDLAHLIVSLRYTFELNGDIVIGILKLFRDIHAKIEAKSNDQLTYEKAAKNVREYDHVIAYIVEGNECVYNGYYHCEIVEILQWRLPHQQFDIIHEVPLLEIDDSYYDSIDADCVPVADISIGTPCAEPEPQNLPGSFTDSLSMSPSPLQRQTARFESCDNEISIVRHLTF